MNETEAVEGAALLRKFLLDGFMSCPCGRGDYHLCQDCPYDWCSVHGTAASPDNRKD